MPYEAEISPLREELSPGNDCINGRKMWIYGTEQQDIPGKLMQTDA